jgi:hypothetical protein
VLAACHRDQAIVQLALCTTRDLAPALRGVPLVQPAAAALVAGVAGA